MTLRKERVVPNPSDVLTKFVKAGALLRHIHRFNMTTSHDDVFTAAFVCVAPMDPGHFRYFVVREMSACTSCSDVPSALPRLQSPALVGRWLPPRCPTSPRWRRRQCQRAHGRLRGAQWQTIFEALNLDQRFIQTIRQAMASSMLVFADALKDFLSDSASWRTGLSAFRFQGFRSLERLAPPLLERGGGCGGLPHAEPSGGGQGRALPLPVARHEVGQVPASSSRSGCSTSRTWECLTSWLFTLPCRQRCASVLTSSSRSAFRPLRTWVRVLPTTTCWWGPASPSRRS